MAKSAAQRAAEAVARQLRELLRARLLFAHVDVRRSPVGGRDHWEAVLVPRLPLDIPLHGSWTISASWTFTNVVDADEAYLVLSSMGLNVTEIVDPVLSAYSGREELNVVRYDFDIRPPRRGAHVQVHQPTPLASRVHWELPDGRAPEDQEWPLELLLEWLLSPDLHADLAARGWPA